MASRGKRRSRSPRRPARSSAASVPNPAGGRRRGAGYSEDMAAATAVVTGVVAACTPVSRDFARRAGELVSEHVGKAAALFEKSSDVERLTSEVREEAVSLLALEDTRGRRLAQLRSRTEELHRRLRVLAGGVDSGARCFTVPALGGATNFNALTSWPHSSNQGNAARSPSPALRRAAPPWAPVRRTERPRLL